MHKLNQVDTSKWSAKEVLEFVLEYEKDISFSDYARLHIDKVIKRGQERTSRNYKWALQHLEKFARTDNLMFSRLTSAFLNRWIETLSQTTTRILFSELFQKLFRMILIHKTFFA